MIGRKSVVLRDNGIRKNYFDEDFEKAWKAAAANELR